MLIIYKTALKTFKKLMNFLLDMNGKRPFTPQYLTRSVDGAEYKSFGYYARGHNTLLKQNSSLIQIMQKVFIIDSREFSVIKKISKGYTSEVFLVKEGAKRFALKLEKQKSPRQNMVEKEALNLMFVNSAGIGPRLECFDPAQHIVVMEYINGQTFDKWLFGKKPSKKILSGFVIGLLEQGKTLDCIGISHGQLGGKGRNILVRKNRPVIIDFEKASTKRRCRNQNQLRALILENPNSAIVKKVKEIFECKK